MELYNDGIGWYNGVCFRLEVLIGKQVVFGGIRLY